MKLILTRHGETIENKKGIIQGHSYGRLSKEGILQAKRLAQRLKNEKIDCIYSSDLNRAKDTAKEVAKLHGLKINYIQELRERNLGKLTGKKKADIKNWEEIGKRINKLNNKDFGTESLNEMGKRAKKLIKILLKKHKNQTVLLVSHGGFSKALIGAITNESLMKIFNSVEPGNTNVSVFEIYEDKKNKVHLLNCTKHLD